MTVKGVLSTRSVGNEPRAGRKEVCHAFDPTALTSRPLVGPVGWVGWSVLASMGYLGGITLFSFGVAGWFLWSGHARDDAQAVGFMKSAMQQISLDARPRHSFGRHDSYRDGLISITAGVLRQYVRGWYRCGGRSRLAEEPGRAHDRADFFGHSGLADDSRAADLGAAFVCRASSSAGSSSSASRGPTVIYGDAPGVSITIDTKRLAAPRIAAAAIACLLLSQWGIMVGTLWGGRRHNR